MINKKVIKISERNWKKLKSLNIGSMDKTLNTVMDIVEHDMPFVEYSDDKMKSINLYEDTFNRLNSFKLSDTEAKENVVTRLLVAFDEINNFTDIEIPFKLTSPLNKELIIEGMCTPTELVIPRKQESLEYKAWLKLLNFDEIHKLILENEDEIISFNNPHYRLDINYSSHS